MEAGSGTMTSPESAHDGSAAGSRRSRRRRCLCCRAVRRVGPGGVYPDGTVRWPVERWPRAPDAPSSAPFGMVVSGPVPTSILPLSGAHAFVRIAGCLAQVTLRQTWVNTSKMTLNAAYSLPMDPRAGVNGFSVLVDGKEVIGRVMERGAAREEFKDAVARGDGGYLLEEHEASKDVFTVAVGSLPPGVVVQLSVSFVTVVESVGDDLRFTLPSVIAPRFTESAPVSTGTGAGGAGDPGASGGGASYPMSLDAELHLSSTITAIASPTHDISVTECVDGDSRKARVSFSNDTAGMSGDFVLIATEAAGRVPYAMTETAPNDSELAGIEAQAARAATDARLDEAGGSSDKLPLADDGGGGPEEDIAFASNPPNLIDGGSKAVMVSFFPLLDASKFEAEAKSEVIAVIDCSGSMRGDKMTAAKETLRLLVSALPEGAYFNIVSFGSRHSMLFPFGSVPFTDGTKATAMELISRMDANMGGTNISRPLAEVFAADAVKGQARQVVLITDGRVRDTHEVVELVRRAHSSSGVRVFSFGIGSGVSHALVRDTASAGGGVAEFAVDGERMQPKVMRMVGRMLQPTLTNVRLDWGDVSLVGVPTPARIPAVYSGDRVMFFARVVNSGSRGIVTLFAETPDGPRQWEVSLPSDCEMGTLVHTSFARSRISELEATGDASSVAAAVDLAKTHNLTCRNASFVAVERRDNQSRQEALRSAAVTEAIDVTRRIYCGRDVVRAAAEKARGKRRKEKKPRMLARSRARSRAMPSHDVPLSSISRGMVSAPAPRSSVADGRVLVESAEMDDSDGRVLAESDEMDDAFLAPPPPPASSLAPFARSVTSRPSRGGSVPELEKDSRPGGRAAELAGRSASFVSLLVSAQRANGSWDATPDVIRVMGISRESVAELASAIGKDNTVAVTLLCLAALRSWAADTEDEWGLVASKAARWLKGLDADSRVTAMVMAALPGVRPAA